MNNEVWKPVVGYEGKYEVSSRGHVRSLCAKRKGLLLAQYLRPDGYLQVQLKVDQRPKNFLVHVLVDDAFNGPRIAGLEINHIDGSKRNNDKVNLERITRKENVQHAFRSGLCGSRKGEKNSQSSLTDEQAALLRAEGAKHFKNGRLAYGALRVLADKYGIARSTVSAIVRGSSWKHLEPVSA